MSSPLVRVSGGFDGRHTASSPPRMLSSPTLNEPSIRPMRLKVLYTFDSENKTNCLARWHQIMNIRTACLDENTQIGVIELKICLQAIVHSSPEITAKLGQDYTVYAYDYSEYETPLVGQGMLSWALAASSSTPSAPASQSRTVVTGRVCKSILGLFGNGIQETLEVKLRLVPVPTCLQSEYIESMRKYRDLSRIMPEDFDPQAWTDFLRVNPHVMALVGNSSGVSPSATSDSPQHGLERIQQLMSREYEASSGESSVLMERRASSPTTVASGQETVRLGSPTPSLQSTTTTQPTRLNRCSRTNSRASDRQKTARPRRTSNGSATDPGLASGEERQDEGPVKKRAKIMKAEHPGKSNSFGKNADSLRVTASTAASIRVFQPTAVRPSTNLIRSLEGPPRVPTPIPQAIAQSKRPSISASRSGLNESFMTSDSGYKSYLADSDTLSPEKATQQSYSNSPDILGSSPPVFREASVAPSSPVLPALPHPRVQETVADTFDDLFEDGTNDVMSNEVLLSMGTQQRIQETTDTKEMQPNAGSLGQVPSVDQQEEVKRKELSMRNARKALGLKRSETWAGEQRNHNSSHLSKRKQSTSVGAMEPKPRGGWDKEKRKKAIQSKLNSSLQAGEMPPFCENCGAIETPTWRKAYSRLHSGDHSQVTVSNEEGGIIAVQVVDTYEDGSTKTFKIFKKSRTTDQDDEGFADVLLCNPCGIWLSKSNCMRPPNLWAKDKAKSEASKEKPRKGKAKKKIDNSVGQSSFQSAPSEAVTLASEVSINPQASDSQRNPGDVRGIKEIDFGNYDSETLCLPSVPSLKKCRSMSLQNGSVEQLEKSDITIDPSALAALHRAIQSSPGHNHFLGSKKSPIDVDSKSPDPARRTLFRSPKSSGPLGLSAPDKTNSTRRLLRGSKNDKDHDEIQADKENLPPLLPSSHDELDELFLATSPQTPSRGDTQDLLQSPSNLFKTPRPGSSPTQRALTTGDFFSSAAKAFLHPKTPSRAPAQANQCSADLTPFTIHLNQLLSENPNTSPNQLLSELDNLPAINFTEESTLDGNTPSRVFRAAGFDFGAFDSSDLPVPSSPPSWFGVYEDPDEGRKAS